MKKLRTFPIHQSNSPSFNGERNFDVIGTGKLPLENHSFPKDVFAVEKVKISHGNSDSSSFFGNFFNQLKPSSALFSGLFGKSEGKPQTKSRPQKRRTNFSPPKTSEAGFILYIPGSVPFTTKDIVLAPKNSLSRKKASTFSSPQQQNKDSSSYSANEASFKKLDVEKKQHFEDYVSTSDKNLILELNEYYKNKKKLDTVTKKSQETPSKDLTFDLLWKKTAVMPKNEKKSFLKTDIKSSHSFSNQVQNASKLDHGTSPNYHNNDNDLNVYKGWESLKIN